MSHVHEGVSCDSCFQTSFRGKRYKCLLCYDFDLCSACYESGAVKQQHKKDHPMQCILPRADMDLYYGGEPLAPNEQPQSYTCPYCCKMGFTYTTLAGHMSKNHTDTVMEVICPVCVTQPGGDPNRLTEDLARHLVLGHCSTTGEIILDDAIAVRVQDARRTTPLSQQSFLGRARPRRSNMQFTPGPLSAQVSSLRSPGDPIAELLSRLSGVRRTASNNDSEALHHFQMQMQWQVDGHLIGPRHQLQRLSHFRNLSERKPPEAETPPAPEVVKTKLPHEKFLLPKTLSQLSLSKLGDGQRQAHQEFLQQLVMSSISKPKAGEDEGIEDVELEL